MSDEYEQVTLGTDSSGRPLVVNRRTEAMLDAVEERLGFDLTVVQGSYMGDHAADASSHTHDGGGVVDIRTWDLTAEQRDEALLELRRVGFAAWYRTPEQGFDEHFHAVAIGDKTLHDEAQGQVEQYYDGLNGLGDPDDGPPVPIHPFVYGEAIDDFGIDDGAPITAATDRDEDGLTDEFERLLGTRLNQSDSDHDQLSDAYETYTSHTDPLAADTDGDKVADAVEVARGSNAGEAPLPDEAVAAGFGGAGTVDRDDDDLSDLYEARIGSDPSKADSDGDGVLDGTEVALGSDLSSIDSDRDGLADLFEARQGTLGQDAAGSLTPDPLNDSAERQPRRGRDGRRRRALRRAFSHRSLRRNDAAASPQTIATHTATHAR